MNHFVILEHSHLPSNIIMRKFKAKIIDFTNCSTVIVGGVHYSKEELFGPIIKVNKVKCNTCNTILESVYTNHSTRCKCGLCKIDGGRSILDRTECSGEYIELSDFIVPAGSVYTREQLITMHKKL